ncbi:MAG: hypothetical protein J6I68_11460 [Butyrivibrio sp.]|uniref:hypothetical protein n=1 Tax=Butyrivibrio sp. TaxID=28121 RepID=UPI001B59DB2A|nr:hypothetical protein [Butyrivibrio sp.]MBP3783853.1 hypothetical protein [Butyrivibrio sp.]
MDQNKIFLNDYEEKMLNSREALQEYLDHIEATDKWVTPTVNECQVLGLDSQTNVEEVLKVNNVSISNDEVMATIENDNHFSLYVNNLFGNLVHPVRYTAFPDIEARAGLYGRAIENSTEKQDIQVLPVRIKAFWLSQCFALNAEPCKILVRDGKISSMKSKKYQPFMQWEVVSHTENRLSSIFPEYEYSTGRVSHEGLVVEYKLNAKMMEDGFANLLSQFGFGLTADDIKTRLLVSTSDIGSSCVAASPIIEVQGTPMRLGKRIELRHDVGNTLEMWEEALTKVAASLQEAEDRVEELGNTSIVNAQSVFETMAEELKIPKKIYQSVQFIATSAMDIYLALNQCVGDMAGDLNLSQMIDMQEKVARYLYVDYAAYDRRANV